MGASSDIPDDFLQVFERDCRDVLRCDPKHLASVAFPESGWHTWAWNRGGNASGLWQVMPETARGLGWDPADCIGVDAPPLARFRSLTHLEQWKAIFRPYFASSAGKLVSRAACYVKTFLPADLELASNPAAVLVQDPKTFEHARRGFAFEANQGFDANGDHIIVVQELDDMIERAARGPRCEDLFHRFDVMEDPGIPVKPLPFPEAIDLGTPIGLQRALNRVMLAHIDEDGVIGPLTRRAIENFQGTHGLTVDGIFGPKTRKELSALLVAMVPNY